MKNTDVNRNDLIFLRGMTGVEFVWINKSSLSMSRKNFFKLTFFFNIY